MYGYGSYTFVFSALIPVIEDAYLIIVWWDRSKAETRRAVLLLINIPKMRYIVRIAIKYLSYTSRFDAVPTYTSLT